jgi:hypothetical protein
MLDKCIQAQEGQLGHTRSFCASGRESRTSIDLMIYLSFAQTKSADERIAVAIDPDVRRPARGRTS